MIEDAELLRRYAEEKSEAAFAELVRLRIGLVYSVALRHTHDAHRAEDVTQAVFTDLARKAGKLAQRPVLVGWLYRSAQFAAGAAVRTERRRQEREQEAHTMQQTEQASPEPDWEKLRPVLDEVLNEMDERDRDAVLLRFFDGQPFADIGAKLRLTENAARMRVERALKKMRDRLARRGVTSTEAALGLALSGQAGAAAPAGFAASVAGAALAGATATKGGAMILTLMSTKKWVVAISILVAVLGTGTALFEFKMARDAGVALATARRERDELRAKVDALSARVPENRSMARNATAGILETGKAGRTNSSASAPSGVGSVSGMGAQLVQQVAAAKGRLEEARTTPEFRQLAVEMAKAEMPLRYGVLYGRLGLTPAQIANFEACLAEGMQGAVDVLSVAKENGVSALEPAIVALGSDAKQRQDERLRALLGETGFEQYLDYELGVGARAIVGRMTGSLMAGDSPLTFEQVDRLAKLLAANGAADGNPANVNWGAVMDQAQGFMSQHQLETLRAMQNQINRGAESARFLREYSGTGTRRK